MLLFVVVESRTVVVNNTIFLPREGKRKRPVKKMIGIIIIFRASITIFPFVVLGAGGGNDMTQFYEQQTIVKNRNEDLNLLGKY